jgi:hypothetical protein
MGDTYGYRFDFDGEDDPPKVYLTTATPQSRWLADCIEIFEEPTLLADVWSWDEDDWQLGPFAQAVLDTLNAHMPDVEW